MTKQTRRVSAPTAADEATVYELITAAKAEYYLSKNVWYEAGKDKTNRKISQAKVMEYKSKMLRPGVWHTTHQGIGISFEDKLIDGQHRLLAIREAARTNPNIAIRMAVTTGMHPDAYKYVDKGKRRQLQEVLSYQGMGNVRILSSTARMVWCYFDVAYESLASWSGDGFDEDLLEETLAKHPLIHTATDVCSPLRRIGNPVSLGAVYAIATELRPDVEVEKFFWQVRTGEHIGSEDPAYELRERLSNHTGGRSQSARLEQMAFTIQALNQFARGGRVKRGSLRLTKFMAFPRIAAADAPTLDDELED